MRLAGGPGWTASFVPAGEFRTGRSRLTFDRADINGALWPPLDDCRSEIRGFSMKAAALRPAAALQAMMDLSELTGLSCGVNDIASGEILIGDSPPLRLELGRARYDRQRGVGDLRVIRLDSEPTSLVVRGEDTGGQIRATGEWNLSGLDVTALLSRIGLAWSSRTEVGLLEFESAGNESQESGRLQISSWVLLGQTRPRPFRLAVPRVTAEFTVGDSDLVFQTVTIDRPTYDLLGARPEVFSHLLSGVPRLSMNSKKISAAKLPVSERHQSRVESLPAEFAVRVDHLRIDTGAGLMLDRPEQTQFILKISDLAVLIHGPAKPLSLTPNTDIHFFMNDKKEMRWKAVTDFSTWPPRFRLTDVR